MKTISLLLLCLTGLQLSAQEQSQIPKISSQITEYFNYHKHTKVFLTTDKSHYKPGETIWLSAFLSNLNNQPIAEVNGSLHVKLFDKKGNTIVQETFKTNVYPISGDLEIPEDIATDQYFLVAYTSLPDSPDEIFLSPIKIDPEFSDQWVAETELKDSVSISGQKNELLLVLREISGDKKKNTLLRYEVLNGTKVIDKGKLKTDNDGKATIPFIISGETDGNPFRIMLTDIKDEWRHEVFIPTNIDPIIIKFYPEGGNLTTGIATKIGFTAFNKWGLPIDIVGTLTNQDDKPVTMVKTFVKGLGQFPVNNDGTQKLKLVITGKTGTGQSFTIPAPDSNGMSLSIARMDADFISTNLAFADKQKHSVSLMLSQGNKIYWAADMEIAGIGRIKIPTENLPQGINLLSAFTETGTLLAERIVFQKEKNELKISVQPAKTSLQTTDSMKVKIRITDSRDELLSGHFAISVSDLMRQSTLQQQINEYIPVSSELETPFSLVSGNMILFDNFLIANRIKGFYWDKIRQFKPENISDPNSVNNEITGEVTDKSGNKVNKAKVSLVNNKNMQLLTTITNAEGVFSFTNIGKGKSEDYTAKATDQEGKRELNITFRKNMDGLISDYVSQMATKYGLSHKDKIASASYFENNSFLFPKTPSPVKTNATAYESQRKLLSGSTNLLDVIKSVKPFRLVNNQIVFFGSENSLNFQGGALIVLDGQQMGTDVSALSNLSTTEIDHFTVSTNPMDIQRYTGLNSVGLIEIFLKNGKYRTTEPMEKSKNKYDGLYRISNTFPTEPVNPKRDVRTTLLWIPDQKIDSSGEFWFTITAGKVISDFEINVQGISDNGQMGSGKAVFSVTK